MELQDRRQLYTSQLSSYQVNLIETFQLLDNIIGKNVTLSEEHTDISWAGKEDSKVLIPNFKDLQAMLDDAISFIH